jgi:sugar-phosphatase
VAATITHFLPHITPETLQSMVSAQLDQECTQLDSVKPAVGGRELLIWLDAPRLPWGGVTHDAESSTTNARVGATPQERAPWR